MRFFPRFFSFFFQIITLNLFLFFQLFFGLCLKLFFPNTLNYCFQILIQKNSTQTIFQGGTSWVAQLLNNIIVWMVLYCEHQLLGVEKKTKPFLHLSLGKADAFTLESYICVKTLKCKVFQIIRCLIKPLLKNSTQTIFQGDTSWLAQLLNNIIVWMVLYCEHQLLGAKKTQNPFSTFLWVNLMPLL